MKIKYKSIILACVIFLGTGLFSCTKYLDKAPEASISENDAYGTFMSFQGFTEELYMCTPDYTKATYDADWELGDEVIATANNDWRMCTHMDNGDYWCWYNGNGWSQSYLRGCSGGNWTNSDGWGNKSMWDGAWYGIRKANLGLQNLDKLVTATQEEKDIIKGQLLFFRGFFHFQLMQFFGGLPYIDKVLTVGNLTLPRLSYQQTAAKAAEDFAAAAELLPANWDNTVVGQATLGNNQQRITKSTAYAYLGKDLLFAASPLMNRESKGIAAYDQDLCKQAAAAFAKCLALTDNGQAPYKMASWANYMDNFYVLNSNNKIPGYEEALFTTPLYGGTGDICGVWFPSVLGGAGNCVSLSADYAEYFGMANGLSITDAGSGYTEADPWTGRDPRFYKFIVYDNVRVIQAAGNATARYANLYTTGNYRNEGTGNRTGYMISKFVNLTGNATDNIGRRVHPPYLRLADVYYMYAEAVLWGYGNATTATAPGYTLTAAAAVNIVRNRATVPNVDARYLDTQQHFMDMLIKERAVELMGEANIRFCDLRRWLLLTDMKYRLKTALDFDRNPTTGKPVNITKRIVVTRVVDNKHYWLPLPTNQVNLYPGFGQNPGW
jgi:starch-binding outer membrane protein, SusD/RagB family